MSEPEISHRCPACGAAVRARATFCPQCGRPTQKDERTEVGAVIEAAELPKINAQEGRPVTEAIKLTEPDESMSSNSKSSPVKSTDNDDGRARAEVPGHRVLDERARMKRRRVASVARDARDAVEERLGPRVEKLRQASNIVFDEASYDPSLRFVLIAIFIFIVFVVILLASNALG